MSSRLTEGQIRVAVLRLLARSRTGFLKTSELINQAEVFFRPEGMDAEILDGRNDTYFSQKVRNLVCHRDASTSLESRGFATYDADLEGWTITDQGRDFVDSCP